MFESLDIDSSSYVRRDEDELQQVKAERRPGRPASTREDLLNRRIASDAQEYNSGYWIPDVTDDDTFKKLQSWTGEWSALGTIKFVRLTREGLLLPSSFPPKGQS